MADNSLPKVAERSLPDAAMANVTHVRVVSTDNSEKLPIENLTLAGTKVTVAVDGLSGTVDGAFADVLTAIAEKADTTQVQALDAEKIDKTSIVGTTGTSETSVMHQKAVTEKFNDVEYNIKKLDDITEGKALTMDATYLVNDHILKKDGGILQYGVVFGFSDYVPVNKYQSVVYNRILGNETAYAGLYLFSEIGGALIASFGGSGTVNLLDYPTAKYICWQAERATTNLYVIISNTGLIDKTNTNTNNIAAYISPINAISQSNIRLINPIAITSVVRDKLLSAETGEEYVQVGWSVYEFINNDITTYKNAYIDAYFENVHNSSTTLALFDVSNFCYTKINS